MDDWLTLLLAGVPIAVATVAALVEVVRRTDVGPGRTTVWVVALIGIPVVGVAIYAIVRPIGGRRSASHDARGSTDAERVVEAFEQRQRGEIDDDGLHTIVTSLGR